MFFKRSKVLTGLVTFTMAAAVMGGPVQAMDLSACFRDTEPDHGECDHTGQCTG